MNKDVIYIEPEDDITDIITKIENSKSKIIALVPPKKAGVFRSVVNIKLIAKAGKTAAKSVVIVSADPSITKLAAATKLPVAKNLESAPKIPSTEPEIEAISKEELKENLDEKPEEEPEEGPATEDEPEAEPEETEEDEEEPEEEPEIESEEEKKPKEKAKKQHKNKFISWIAHHKKTTIAICIVFLLAIIFLIWAFAIAPAVDVTVSIKADSEPFSESISFVDKIEDEKAEEGKFYLEEKKIEKKQKVEFEATGKKNTGEKATGEVLVYAYFPLNKRSIVQINSGEIFTISGLSFVATESKTLSYSGEGHNECANKDNFEGLVRYGCRINGKISVIASEPGSKYNIAASSTGWDTNATVFAYSENSMSGGTDNVITVVQQSDIEKAKEKIESGSEEENKKELYEKISDDSIILESTFSQSTSAAVSTPAADEEVKEGVTPTVEVTTTVSVLILDQTKLEEYIRTKAKIENDEKIYEIQNVFLDSFAKTADGYVGKLKAKYFVGPKITEGDVLEKIKGRGIGDAIHELKDIDNVIDVSVEKSYPWVMTIPGDTNKITVNFEIMDQNGEKIEEKTEEEEKEEKDSKSEETKKDEDSGA